MKSLFNDVMAGWPYFMNVALTFVMVGAFIHSNYVGLELTW